MKLDLAALSADFEEARRAAIEATDRFHAARDIDPSRATLWRDVVTRKEASRRLLLRWLDAEAENDPQHRRAGDSLLGT